MPPSRVSGKLPRPDIGDDEPFDRRVAVVRRAVWSIVVPALAVGALLYRTPHAIPSSVIRAGVVYLMVLLIMRLAGKRTLAQLTAFDLVVLLIISEAVQPVLVAEDATLTNAALIVGTLVAMDAFFGVLKERSPLASRWLDDVPTILVREGVMMDQAMKRMRIEKDDLIEAARTQHGLESLDQVRYAVLERTGGISIIPWPDAIPRAR